MRAPLARLLHNVTFPSRGASDFLFQESRKLLATFRRCAARVIRDFGGGGATSLLLAQRIKRRQRRATGIKRFIADCCTGRVWRRPILFASPPAGRRSSLFTLSGANARMRRKRTPASRRRPDDGARPAQRRLHSHSTRDWTTALESARTTNTKTERRARRIYFHVAEILFGVVALLKLLSPLLFSRRD